MSAVLETKTREGRRWLALFSIVLSFFFGLWTFAKKEKEQAYEKEMAAYASATPPVSSGVAMMAISDLTSRSR